MNKLVLLEDLESICSKLRSSNKKIVFTNGCFDVLHLGHVRLLQKCKEFGIVFVGLNSDSSVKKLKGNNRPINNQTDRIEFLKVFDFVDYIITFNEITAEKLIKHIKPDFYIKGNDYKAENLECYDFIKSYGGKVLTFGFGIDKSTTKILNC